MTAPKATHDAAAEPVLCDMRATKHLTGLSHGTIYDLTLPKDGSKPLLESVLVGRRRLWVVESIKTLPARLKACAQRRAP